MRKFKLHVLVEELDVSGWKAKPNSQMGSNEGGVHTDPLGKKYYVKIAKNPEQARQEVASSKLHELMGVSTLKPKLITKNGRLGTATEWNEHLETQEPHAYKNVTPEQAAHIARIHHAGVITKNWDTVGLSYDNIGFHAHTGVPHSLDQGGSLEFRAQGGHKDFSPDIGEIESFRDGRNAQSAHVFNSVFKKHPNVEKEQLTHLRGLNYNNVSSIFKETGVKDHDRMTKTLLTRRDLLLKHYGAN